METLEIILTTILTNIHPNGGRTINQQALTLSRQEVINQLERDCQELQELEIDLAKEYRISLNLLGQMSDGEYQKLKQQLVPNVR